MRDAGPGGRDEDRAVKDTKKAVLKKRKKRLGVNCDKNCPLCRVPCETPIYPDNNKAG